jgi:hypothetical protein
LHVSARWRNRSDRRLALLDPAIEDWRQDRRQRALAAFDRLEDEANWSSGVRR